MTNTLSPQDVQGENLQLLIDRIENLSKEKDNILSDIKNVYDEAKATGYDINIIRKLIANRKKDSSKLDEEFSTYDLYAKAIGM